MPIIRRGKRIKPEDLVKRPRRGRPSPIKIRIEGIKGIEPIWKQLPGAESEESALERRAVSESVFPGSVYERIFYKELVIRRIPFEAQHPFQGGRGGLGGQVVDFIILDRPVLVQVQTSPWHTGYANEEHDKEQKAILESLPHPIFRNERNIVLYIWDWELDVPELTARWFRNNLEMNSWRAGWTYEGGRPTQTPEIALPRRYGTVTGQLKRASGTLSRA